MATRYDEVGAWPGYQHVSLAGWRGGPGRGLVSEYNAISIAGFEVLGANPRRKWMLIWNASGNIAYFRFGTQTADGNCPAIKVGQGFIIDQNNPWCGSIAIASAGCTISVHEVSVSI
jgi:hypothetical protein